MGVVNVTPDSFSDGGVHFDRDRAIAAALRMFEDGAAIVDVGGESTRPSTYGRGAGAARRRRDRACRSGHRGDPGPLAGAHLRRHAQGGGREGGDRGGGRPRQRRLWRTLRPGDGRRGRRSARRRYPDAHEGHGSAHDAGRPVLRAPARRHRVLPRGRRPLGPSPRASRRTRSPSTPASGSEKARNTTWSCFDTCRPSRRSAGPSPSAPRARPSSGASRASPKMRPRPTGCRARSPRSERPPAAARRSSACTTWPNRSGSCASRGPSAGRPCRRPRPPERPPGDGRPDRPVQRPRPPEFHVARRARHPDRRRRHVRAAAPHPRDARGPDGASASSRSSSSTRWRAS